MAAADDDTDTQTAPPAAATSSPDLMAQVMQLAKQIAPQPVQQDTTPVSRSGISLLGEALAGGAPVAGMSDADKETAGTRALMNFSTGLMAASRYQPGQTIFSNLAQGFQGAQRGEIGAEEMAMAKLGAQQEYAQQQGQNKLEAIKAAIPLLNLDLQQQRLRALGNIPSPFGATGGPPNVAQGGSIATVARDTSMTAGQQGNNSGNLMVDNTLPPGAVGRIPVSGGRFVAAFPDVPTGVAAQSDNLTAYAKSGVQTIRQAVNRWVGDPKANTDSYAADVAKAAGVDPDAPVDLSDPKIQRAFLLAQQPHESGKSWLQPSDVDKGIALAVARRGVPGAPPVVGAPPGSPPASTASTTPPAPVVHTSPTLRGPGTPVPPTPQPSIQGVPDSGGTQVGGPGALPGKVAPPGPAVPGDVNTIIAGMIKGGASPTTLAPGAATAGPAAPTVVAANAPVPQASTQANPPPALPGPQVTPPPPPRPVTPSTPEGVPDTFEEYRAQHPIAPTPDDAASFSTAPDPAQLGVLDRQAQMAQTAYNTSKVMGDTAGMAKAAEDYNTILSKENEVRQQAIKLGTETRAKFMQDQNQNLFNSWKAAMDFKQQRITQQQQVQQQSAAKIDEMQQQADITSAQDTTKTMAADAAESRKVMTLLTQMGPQLENLPNGVVGTLVDKYPELVPMLQAGGVVDPKQATNIQLLQSARAYLSLLQKPAASGSLRTAEMSNLASYTPATLNTPQARQEMLGRLLATNQRVIDENNFAGDYFGRTDPTTGKPIYNIRGMDAAMNKPLTLDANGNPTPGSGLGPVVPQAPPLTADPAAHQAYQKYIANNVRQGFPYYTYRQRTDPTTRLPVTDQNGNRVMDRVLRLKGVNDVGPGG